MKNRILIERMYIDKDILEWMKKVSKAEGYKSVNDFLNDCLRAIKDCNDHFKF